MKAHVSPLKSKSIHPACLYNYTLGGFLHPYQDMLANVTLPTQLSLLYETGRIDNFKIASGKLSGSFNGYFPFNDSDVYKWIEAVSYVFERVKKSNPKLAQSLDEIIRDISNAQSEDGYLNTFFMINDSPKWEDLVWGHELYTAGHLIQAAIAHRRFTGQDNMFKVAKKFADLICETFKPGKKEGTCGHPEIEMSLVELYRETGERKYLNQAKYFIEARGKGLASVPRNPGPVYFIDHKPFVELDEVVGHAVRMLYLCCGATDLYLETEGKAIWKTLENLWKDMTTRKMYITGGVGSRHDWESIGEPYELPNRRAYAETCAAIANFMWNYRMFLASGEARFVDVMEQVVYNGLLSGISLDGDKYFYDNPLEDMGTKRRQRWFDCACCPPNIARTIASLPHYIYAQSKDKLWVNLYESSTFKIIHNDVPIEIVQQTDYPWSGDVHIRIAARETLSFTLLLRIPEWSADFDLKLNGKSVKFHLNNGYAELQNSWKGTNNVQLTLKLRPECLQSHPYVSENHGKVAVRSGPVLYCIEQVDNPDFDIWTLKIDSDSFEMVPGEILGKRMFFLLGNGKATNIRSWQGKLYRPKTKTKSKYVTFKLIPYHMWNNRGNSGMRLWLDCTS
ncbi:glycoside hydrolase family 127 protein [Pseudothermotoga thermarum]|uniref:Glycoside hydrolase family 127 protein n=1 Tax=Pseudothermotoga thermarum DSM 5069 TaxID=688269 RepID=F7YTI8_9THEM|nr:beta-L-arabinofuranosidase domain-containing protein [Pseudothermotoga thermarum]AEH51202.1 protein of unknown function DUF1680 [Pseudothermotoga thermarum DSM 5069]